MAITSLDWNQALREQWESHWTHQVRDRLAGLTDEEYLWSPAPQAWSVRPRGTSTTPMAAGAGDLTIDFAYPAPEPAPFTTIAWRLGHVIVGVLAMRTAAHFGGAPVTYDSWQYAGDAATALDQLDTEVAAWLAGVRSLGEDGLRVPVGEREPYDPDAPMAVLVLHIHRELIHHLAEVCLLRDLYLHTHQPGAQPGNGARR